MNIRILACLVLLLFSCPWSLISQSDSLVYKSSGLEIVKISDRAYIHISYLQTRSFGKVACNGAVVINGKEAVVLETPIDNKVSEILIDWVEKEQQAEIKAVIAHHFHVDCVGGLEAFHQKNIPSYAYEKTIELVTKDSLVPPRNVLRPGQEIAIGDRFVRSSFHGPGHTIDNIVTYYPSEEILFGGCLIKSMGSSKGNLADADVMRWSSTVEEIKTTYPRLKIVIPGHGRIGGPELLDYTADLFRN